MKQEELDQLIKKAGPFGSIEIIIQRGQVTQVSYKHIEKIKLTEEQVGIASFNKRKKLDIDKFGHVIKSWFE